MSTTRGRGRRGATVVGRGWSLSDEWHIRIDRRYLDPAAGSGARAKEQELAAGKGRIQRFLDRVTDARTEDRNWRRGAEGEERVAAILARTLTTDWVVVHDLTIGTRGANLDHLLIGPGGVFALHTHVLRHGRQDLRSSRTETHHRRPERPRTTVPLRHRRRR